MFDVLFYTADIAFSFWFVFLVSPLTMRGVRFTPQALLVIWAMTGVVACIRFFNPAPAPSILLPLPVNILLYLTVGVVLFGLTVRGRVLRGGMFWQKGRA